MGGAAGSNYGQILFLTESGHAIYPIEGIEVEIALGPGGSNLGQMLFLAESILVLCQIEGVEGAIAWYHFFF